MNFIHKIPKAYSKDSCNKLIKWFEKNMDKAKPGKTGDEDELKNLEIGLELKDLEDYFGLGKTLINGLKNFKKTYPLIDRHIKRWRLNPFMQLMKYEPNNYYHTIHCENDGTEAFFKRVFAFMIFLNDIKKGGGTKFLFQKIIIKPKAGDLYIWPAYWTHLHQGVNAPKEHKYIITGWVEYADN
tara:strand:- start:123 stop:674 length:552 start_codon:yes stop_codon:yes gene_type:complete